MAQATKTAPAGQREVRPLHDRILVRRIEEENARPGRIVIPDSAKEKPQEGKVIAVGNGRVTDEGKKIPLDVKAGIASSSASTRAARSPWTARNT